MHRKTAPRPLPTSATGAPRRPLTAATPSTSARQLPTVAALAAALLGLTSAACTGGVGGDDPAAAIRADAPPRRPARPSGSADVETPPSVGVGAVIDPEPEPRLLGGKIAPVRPPPVGSATALPRPVPPRPAGGLAMPRPTPRPVRTAGAVAIVAPPSLGSASIGSPPCAHPGSAETY